MTALVFLWLLGLAVLHETALVANWSDNAYLYLVFVGIGLGLAAIPFGVAAAVPHDRIRRVSTLVGGGLLWFVGAVSIVALIQALAIIPSQGYRTPTVFLTHLVSLVLLIVTLGGHLWLTKR